jgi:hypothetical protein
MAIIKWLRFPLLLLAVVGSIGLWFFSLSSYAIAKPGEESFFTHLHTEKAMANVTIAPGRAGPVVITIQLETIDERPLVAMAVALTLTSPRAGAAPLVTAAEHMSDDQWRATLSIPSPGRWSMGLRIKLSEADAVTVQSPILIE